MRNCGRKGSAWSFSGTSHRSPYAADGVAASIDVDTATSAASAAGEGVGIGICVSFGAGIGIIDGGVSANAIGAAITITVIVRVVNSPVSLVADDDVAVFIIIIIISSYSLD